MKNKLLSKKAKEIIKPEWDKMQDFIKETDKELKNEPETGKQYALTGGFDDKCIMNGNTWIESEVKKD